MALQPLVKRFIEAMTTLEFGNAKTKHGQYETFHELVAAAFHIMLMISPKV
jgi:hypothetical protein